jgi:hypothetical protein
MKPSLLTLALLLTSLLTACGGGGGGGTTPSTPTPITVTPPLTGKTSFVSADGVAPMPTSGLAKSLEVAAVAATAPPTADATRIVQEGDIYRVLENGKSILNLNRSRGLQIIDISNPASPRLTSRLALSGDPIELYRIGEKVYVLLNSWTEYRRILKSGKEVLESYNGGALITVDIANRAAPILANVARVPGYIQTSRMTTGSGKAALYVASSEYAAYPTITTGTSLFAPYSGQTNVLSFGINTQGIPESRSTLQLGGYVQALQASADRLMVARSEANRREGSLVSLVDISSPDGTMVQGGEVAVAGIVQKKTNLHIQGNVLRVVSGNWWGTGSNVNHVETFNISQLASPKPIDRATFGQGQQLFATTFLAEKAFFVTYLRQDPFHAFSITADGKVKEESEYIVSGWNDFFVPAENQTRLVGIGHNDENNRRTLAISLYDITNLTNTKPLLARAEVDLTNSWSEANWDDRGFTVLENATSATAANGTRETGLVLLPFSGYDSTRQTSVGGVQIFTFSATTLTRRGVMTHDMGVRRSFLGDSSNGLAANLSDSDLSLFNILNTDAPKATGSLLLAPNYSQFVVLGSVGARYHSISSSSTSDPTRRQDKVELVALTDADGSAPLGTISVTSGSRLYGVGGKLVVVSTKAAEKGVTTTIDNYDVSKPATPVLLGSLSTTELVPDSPLIKPLDMRICGIVDFCWPGYLTPEPIVAGNTLVFVAQTSRNTTNRYWSSYAMQVVSMSDPAKPTLLPKVSLPETDEAVGIVQDGSALWITTKKPEAGATADQPQAKYFVRKLDLANASSPVLGAAISVPGQVMAVVGDTLYTVDRTWNGKTTTATLNTLIVSANLAYLQASVTLTNQEPIGLMVDGSKVVLLHYDSIGQYSMSLYAVGDKGLTLSSTTALPAYASLHMARQNKVLLQTWSGLLLFDVSQVQAPVAQSFFPATSWGGAISVVGDVVYVPAYAYGIYQFNLATTNLAKP